MPKVALTGIKPSGTPHLGNYLGMIRPALALAESYDAYYFIADYHALTTVHEREAMIEGTYEIAATWLALGLDPERVTLYKQSDIPEVFELTWALNCFTPKGLMNRAHAYKAAVDENTEAGRNPDDGVSMGLYDYPVLMASDILIVEADAVPVGADQRQHVEMARDIAIYVNNTYGKVLTVPEAVIREEVAVIPGLDGRKMSKSYDNVIPIFVEPKELRKRVMRIVTDSRPVEEPKDPETDNVFALYRHFAPPGPLEAMRERYLRGGLGYGDAKSELFERVEATFGDARERFERLMADREYIDDVLAAGAERARKVASALMERVREAVGVRRKPGG